MLELKGVVLTTGGRTRLDRCGFAVRPGEILGLVGASGAGKSSALAVAAGVERPERGQVLLGGRDATRAPGRLREKVALAPDRLPGPPDFTAHAWLSLWAELDGVPGAETRARVAAAAERFGVPAQVQVGALSSGQRRRLILARLFVRRPAVYLLDSPDLGLDGEGLRALTGALREVAARGDTVVLAPASPQLPSSVCDRVVCLEKGATVGEAARADADFRARIAAAQGWSA